MGLFDSLFGGAASTAAKKNSQAIQQGVANGTAALGAGTANAIGLLGVNNGSNATAQLGFGYDRGREDVQAGAGQAQGFLGQVSGLYDPLKQSGQAALGSRDDALGLNGADGLARAKDAFSNSLGRDAGLSTGIDAVMRTAAARGMLGSGNASADLYRFGNDYADQKAGAYVDRLTGASGNLNTAISGQAGALGAQAGAAQAAGNTLGQQSQTYGQNLSDLYSRGASAYLNQGQGVANLNSQATQQSVQNNNQLAASQAQAGENLLGALGGGLMGFSNIGGLTGLKKLFA